MEVSGYEVRESARARHVRVTVNAAGEVVVTKPKRLSSARLEVFVEKHREWIEEAQRKMRERAAGERKNGIERIQLPRLRRGTKAYAEAVEQARALARGRLAHFAALYGFTYGTISIRNQKTRWGSCSARGNLSFNYRIIYLPEALQDYLIVHELCHLKEHNHSARFWAQVARTVPDCLALRRELRTRYV